MQCPFCKENIPHYSPVCFNCLRKIKYTSEVTGGLPPCDMYGSNITEIHPDSQKVAARETTIKLKYLNSKIQKNEMKRKNMKVERYALTLAPFALLVLFAVIIFGAIIVTAILGDEEKENIRAALMVLPFGLLILGLPMIMALCSEKDSIKKDRKKLEIENNDIKMHKNKFKYYYNDRIFGFSTLGNTSTGIFRCYFYEIDKSKIESISYDTYNSEYVLRMLNLTFMDYNLPSTFEFRIPDVFDDTQLSIALGLDLPAKYIGF